MAYTKGFDPVFLADHFQRHGQDFGAGTAQIYEAMADTFLGESLGSTTQECIRTTGDILRYDSVSDEFGILAANGVIRTYYKPSPAFHLQPTNLVYFQKECLK